MRARLVGVNERGRRIGEHHGNAKLTDADVERLRQLHESGLGYTELARIFEVSRTAVRKIVNYQMRAQVALAWRPPGRRRVKGT